MGLGEENRSGSGDANLFPPKSFPQEEAKVGTDRKGGGDANRFKLLCLGEVFAFLGDLEALGELEGDCDLFFDGIGENFFGLVKMVGEDGLVISEEEGRFIDISSPPPKLLEGIMVFNGDSGEGEFDKSSSSPLNFEDFFEDRALDLEPDLELDRELDRELDLDFLDLDPPKNEIIS
mmetsp:Transcript_36130/g.49570  ORF Transcript_36130/g.49570 Transcript_36130/m.49570 type:complete len:177 (+) Transcript_36130:70-600(+)|eukprot:CAMPEP_0201502164 /NCGR_PEP_ID=MMETSP0151_2-20130828/83988_1 /ASSEMBLY_ACC=CAM_ASM_000257 /TAXON_ID=200890 /ORGANISM="Paramoeba atlantica, Strain 621/1 / CCAP 1560/9" /LENGTH=176 /DNA_ID=CAMNT_0047895737 /DNA_START=56 /DNA_END=586 /DNA_ORIENTATION=-